MTGANKESSPQSSDNLLPTVCYQYFCVTSTILFIYLNYSRDASATPGF